MNFEINREIKMPRKVKIFMNKVISNFEAQIGFKAKLTQKWSHL